MTTTVPQGRKKRVGIFKLRFPVTSETFITSQALALAAYQPLILARQRIRDTPLPLLALSDHDPTGLRRLGMALSRSASWWVADDRVRRLALIQSHFGLDSVYALSLADRLSLPLVSTFHGLDTTARRWPLFISQFGVTVINYVLFFNRLRRRGALFIAASDFLAECLRSQGFPPERIVRLYIGVDTERFSPGPPTEGAGRERYLLNVARHIPVKGIPVLLRAFAEISGRHPSVALLQVGAGPQTPMLQRLARELGLADRVRFLGEQPPERIRELMRGAELLALTSETAASGAREGLGLVLNEASACGIPVVATRCGGIPEAVDHGRTGLLSAEGDIRDLAEALDLLLGDDALRQRMGRAGREHVCRHFCLRTQTALLELLYDRVIDRWHGSES